MYALRLMYALSPRHECVPTTSVVDRRGRVDQAGCCGAASGPSRRTGRVSDPLSRCDNPSRHGCTRERARGRRRGPAGSRRGQRGCRGEARRGAAAVGEAARAARTPRAGPAVRRPGWEATAVEHAGGRQAGRQARRQAVTQARRHAGRQEAVDFASPAAAGGAGGAHRCADFRRTLHRRPHPFLDDGGCKPATHWRQQDASRAGARCRDPMLSRGV
jgi:hypothetical protein